MLDGELATAPYVRTCGACRSPWVVELDAKLALGLTPAAIRQDLSGRRPACPNAAILRAHVDHLPQQVREIRRQAEDPSRSMIGPNEAVDSIIQQGYRALAAGEIQLSSGDWIRALGLRVQMDRQQERAASAEQWQAFQAECYTRPEIMAVSTSALSSPAPVPGRQAVSG